MLSPLLLRLGTVGLSLVLFLAACASPALYVANRFTPSQDRLGGLQLLLTGWLGPIDLQFGWFANPLLFAGWLGLLLGWPRVASGLALVALPVGLLTLTIYANELPANEGTADGIALQHPGPGFYLWLASMVVVLVGGVVVHLRQPPG